MTDGLGSLTCAQIWMRVVPTHEGGGQVQTSLHKSWLGRTKNNKKNYRWPCPARESNPGSSDFEFRRTDHWATAPSPPAFLSASCSQPHLIVWFFLMWPSWLISVKKKKIKYLPISDIPPTPHLLILQSQFNYLSPNSDPVQDKLRRLG